MMFAGFQPAQAEKVLLGRWHEGQDRSMFQTRKPPGGSRYAYVQGRLPVSQGRHLGPEYLEVEKPFVDQLASMGGCTPGATWNRKLLLRQPYAAHPPQHLALTRSLKLHRRTRRPC